jgi:hypothetical protein
MKSFRLLANTLSSGYFFPSRKALPPHKRLETVKALTAISKTTTWGISTPVSTKPERLDDITSPS